MQVMSKAFTDIDYKNATHSQKSRRGHWFMMNVSMSSRDLRTRLGCIVGSVFGPPQMKCFYIDQMGKKGPDFDEEKGWQK